MIQANAVSDRLLRLLFWLLPFHAFVVTVLGSVVGGRALFQSWKELLILVLAGLVVAAARQQKSTWRRFPRELWWTIFAFGLGAGAVTALMQPPLVAVLFGLKTDLAFLVLFLAAGLLATNDLSRNLEKIILISGLAVAAITFIQLLVPTPWMTALGYGSDTIQPDQYVAGQLAIRRGFSTLGGPNQLGSFLLLPLAIALGLNKRRWHTYAAIGLIGLALIMTFSRSAWLAAALMTGAILLSKLPKSRRVIGGLLAGIGLVAFIGLGTAWLRQSVTVQSVVLHGDLFNYGIGPDSERRQALETGLKVALDAPLGLGLGTAGPASFHTKRPLISENYYLQLAIETGWLGLVLFVVICLYVAMLLWQRREHSLALPLLYSLGGISLINLFLHGWADSTTALLWWGSAGVVIGAPNERKR